MDDGSGARFRTRCWFESEAAGGAPRGIRDKQGRSGAAAGRGQRGETGKINQSLPSYSSLAFSVICGSIIYVSSHSRIWGVR